MVVVQPWFQSCVHFMKNPTSDTHVFITHILSMYSSFLTVCRTTIVVGLNIFYLCKNIHKGLGVTKV